MYSRHCYYDSWCYRNIPYILTRFQDNAKEALHVFPSMFNIFGVKVLTVPLPFQAFYLLFQLFQLLLSPCSVEFFYSMSHLFHGKYLFLSLLNIFRQHFIAYLHTALRWVSIFLYAFRYLNLIGFNLI